MPTAAEYFDSMRAMQSACTTSLKTLDFAILPPSAQELARLLGLPTALTMVDLYGGLTLRIPHGNTPLGLETLHDLANHLGDPSAKALAQKYAGTALVVPNCKKAMQKARDAAILEDRRALAAEGLSERALVQCLVLKYRLTERYVWRIFKKPAPDPPPPAQQQASLM
ncbi:Mor transcription activator family protein [Desulfovibrio falkowii]|uniref:Mor transcription activator domain-containing protein n=1 Tax=Desulfovibrio falkowii TaxID=3136602 RepID=A0ABQ0E9Y5_9BACT